MRRLLVVASTVALLVGSACGFARPDPIRLQAEFDDVMDLTEQAPVFTGDVEIGTVTAIELSERNDALVTMDVEPDTGLPSQVEAVVLQTSLLGERAVQLVALNDTGELASGTVPGEVQDDLEDLVTTGTDLLAFVAADRLNAAIHAGAVTFAERGGTVGSLIEDLETFVGEYDARTDEVTRLLDSLDAWLGTLAQDTEANARALEVLARSTGALMEEDEHLLDSLEDLRTLAVNGERVLRDNREQLDEFLAQLDVIVGAVTAVEGALGDLLLYLPLHDLHVPNGNLFEFVQIWQDAIVCGTSSAAELADNPAKSCTPPNPGESNEPSPGHLAGTCHQRGEGCVDDHRTRNQPNDFGERADDDTAGRETCSDDTGATDTCPYAEDRDRTEGGG